MDASTDYNLRYEKTHPGFAARWGQLNRLETAVAAFIHQHTGRRNSLGLAFSLGPPPAKGSVSAEMPHGAFTSSDTGRGHLQDAYAHDPNTRFNVWVQGPRGWRYHDSGTLENILQLRPKKLATTALRSARLGGRYWKKWAVGLSAVAATGFAVWLGFGRQPSVRYAGYT